MAHRPLVSTSRHPPTSITVAVQVFDARVSGGVSHPPDWSVGQTVMQGGRHIEIPAYLGPYPLRVDAGLQRLINAAVAERGEYVILGHRRRTQRPEMGGHQGSELGETHAVSLLIQRSTSGRRTGRTGTLADVGELGFDSTFVTIVMVAGLLVVLLLLIRQWRNK